MTGKYDKKIETPYYSQYEDVEALEWQHRVCGLAAVKMAAEALLGERIVSLDDLIQQGLEKDAYIEGVGWKHDGLIELLKSFAVSAHRAEYKEEGLEDDGISAMTSALSDGGLVITSVAPGFGDNDGSHLILLTGFRRNEAGELEGFYYNDPGCRNEQDGKDLFVDRLRFLEYWRKLVIFVQKG
jgi:hypothetical protein